MKAVAILFFCVALAAAKPREQEIEEDNYYPVDPASVCAQEDSEGVLVADEKYCNRFYNCHAGRPVSFDCPRGLVFNVKKDYCDWPSKVYCGDKLIAEIVEGSIEEETTWVPEHGHGDPALALEICASANSEGVLVANEYCNQYYQCIRGEPFPRKCPEGLLYHPVIESCDWPRNVECGDRIFAVNA